MAIRSFYRFVLTVLLLFQAPAYAEVIDKIASIQQLWATNLLLAIVVGALSYVFASRLLLCSLLFLTAISFAWPPVVPIDFLPEASKTYGPNYLLHAQISALLAPAFAAISFGLKRWRKATINQC
jgi:hypothetical protein